MALTLEQNIRISELSRRRQILERELAAVDTELEDLKERYIQVIFLIGPSSPEWADLLKERVYTYSDPTRSLLPGDLVVAGQLEGVAQVIALGRGEVPYDRPIIPITAVLDRRFV